MSDSDVRRQVPTLQRLTNIIPDLLDVSKAVCCVEGVVDESVMLSVIMDIPLGTSQ